MTRLVWTTTRFLRVGQYQIPYPENLSSQGRWKAGIRFDSEQSRFFSPILWPLVKLRDDLFVDGFVHWVSGRWVRDLVRFDTTFLEIGCGDMSLSKYLPDSVCYNAFDLSVSEFHLKRLLHHRRSANIAVASATNIPLPSSVASLIVATQVLEYIPEVDRALSEIHRVGMSGAKFVCSIANGFCDKYRIKGSHSGHHNRWTYRSFDDLMRSHDFTLVNGEMRGVWIPLPPSLVDSSFALPIRAHRETHNTHFFFVYEVEK